MVKRRRHGKRAEPAPIASLLPAAMRRMGGEPRVREGRIFAAYERAVGEALRRHTRADALHGSTLFARVNSSALAHQITLLRADILAKMRTDLGDDVPTELRTRIGPLDAD